MATSFVSGKAGPRNFYTALGYEKTGDAAPSVKTGPSKSRGYRLSNALVPEFAVSDWQKSKWFYCDILGFECAYERVEEGFCFLRLGEAELMIDQIGRGRTFDDGHLPTDYPFGKGLNVQIRVPSIAPLVDALARCGHPLYLPVEDKWYRIGAAEGGNRQVVVADPDGYLLRFYQELGLRPARG